MITHLIVFTRRNMKLFGFIFIFLVSSACTPPAKSSSISDDELGSEAKTTSDTDNNDNDKGSDSDNTAGESSVDSTETDSQEDESDDSDASNTTDAAMEDLEPSTTTDDSTTTVILEAEPTSPSTEPVTITETETDTTDTLEDTEEPTLDPYEASLAALPLINDFLEYGSNQFLVDMEFVVKGHPYLGRRANRPHTGGHVHVTNLSEWPRFGSGPENYIPIYAVADGVITRVDTYFPVGSNYRYGINLAFAQTEDGKTISFDYSIEPMTNPGDTAFYENFILVQEEDIVHKGDIIAYFYIPDGSGGPAHIHFNASIDGRMVAPSIFSEDIMLEFSEHWNEFGFDGSDEIPVCMGYKLEDDENLFEELDPDCAN